MKKLIIVIGIIVLICSGVIGVSVTVKVDDFKEAKDKIVEWKDEVVLPLIERGFTIDKNI